MEANVLTDHSTGKTYNIKPIGEVRLHSWPGMAFAAR